MRLTANQIKNLPDGTKLKIFYSGSKWAEDFGKVFNVVKIGNTLYHFTEFDDIDDIDCSDGYEIEAAIKEI
jgi:hypothetical protein